MKIARTFRLDDIVLDRLERLVHFYNLQPSESSLPGASKLVNRTDIIEFLINDKFADLKMKGEEL